MKVLVSGATGYVGSRLVPRLLAAGHEVTCMVRDSSRVVGVVAKSCRIVVADCLRPNTLAGALRGIDVAYYLIHSMSAGHEDFEFRDLLAARNFARAARAAGMARVIYLGGLASENSNLSAHLKSRLDTGKLLREFGPPLTEFRAGILVGNGSASFEMVRYLTERLPVMICPRWVVTRTQPIAIDDALAYLAAALEAPESAGEVIEIGGASVETYRSMMLTYARERGLRRLLVHVPVLTPRLSSYWLRIVTPIAASIAQPLIEGLRTEVVCRSPRAAQLFPKIKPVSYVEAVRKTLVRMPPDEGLADNIPEQPAHVAVRRDGILCDVRQAIAPSSQERVFSVLAKLGGAGGYLYANTLWRIRGWLDRRIGGVRVRRGTPNRPLQRGDSFDFWYVQDLVPNRRLLLRADMKVPGRAWLEFRLSPHPAGGTTIRCLAWFEPRGLLGEMYWWVLYPIHILIFKGMVQAICDQACNGRSPQSPQECKELERTPMAS